MMSRSYIRGININNKWLITGNINGELTSIIFNTKYYELTEEDINVLKDTYKFTCILYAKRLYNHTTIW